MLAKFLRNTLNLSENIAKSFRGLYFFDSHCRKYHMALPLPFYILAQTNNEKAEKTSKQSIKSDSVLPVSSVNVVHRV